MFQATLSIIMNWSPNSEANTLPTEVSQFLFSGIRPEKKSSK
jgi:hypothetical protein